MERFRDATVLVTGGAAGIGRSIASGFAAEGARVAVGDIAEMAPDPQAIAVSVRADVTCEGEVNRLFEATEEQLGVVDVLVNNAGSVRGDDVLQIDQAVWDGDLASNLRSAFLCTRRALPGMIKQGKGVVVNIASVNGLAYFGHEAYSAAKAGLISLTQSVAVRYGPHGIRAVAVAPGTIRTPAWSRRLERQPALFERLEKWYPLGRVGEVEDVARAVLFLASDEASWITGTTLCVDGGLTAGHAPMVPELLADQ